jgi:RNA polymerase sigma-70 factor (ECF subfamily)
MLNELPPERLLEVCLDGAYPDAWNEFVRRFQPVVAAGVGRVARQYGLATPALIEDLVQDVYLRLCKNRCSVLREFRSENPDSLYSFLKVIAANTARDHCKATLALKSGGGKVTAMPTGMEEWKATHLTRDAADWRLLWSDVDSILSQAGGGGDARRDKTIFGLYYRQGWSARDISLIPAIGLTQKGVEIVLNRLVKFVRARLGEPVEKGSHAGKSLLGRD